MTDSENNILWREYFYPGTQVLINYFGERDPIRLKELEASNSFDRLLELRENPIHKGFGKEHLIAVHKYIFEDIYPFAGEYRKVNMVKDRGSFLFFDKQEDIDTYLDEVFDEANDGLMYCRSKMQFCELLANLYTRLIYCHPFREGNGRSVREFLREFSIEKSKEVGLPCMELDWSKVNKEELNEYIEVSHFFPGQTAILFMDALVPVDDSKSK